MQLTRRLIGFVLLVPGVVFAAGASPPVQNIADPPQGLLVDAWYRLKLDGVYVGHAHTTRHRAGQDIITIEELTLRTKKLGYTTTHRTRSEFVETVAGKPQRFETTCSRSGLRVIQEQVPGKPLSYTMRFEPSPTDTQPVRVRGTFSGGRLTVVADQYAQGAGKTFDVGADVLMPWAEHRARLRHGFDAGTRYRLTTFDPEHPNQPIATTVEVVGSETITVDGVEYATVKVHEKDEEGKEQNVWYDRDGVPRAADVTGGGLGTLRVTRCTRTEALRVGPEGAFNFGKIIGKATLTVPEHIDARKARRITYRLSRIGPGEPLPPIPQTPMQKVTREADGSVKLVVTRPDPHRVMSPTDRVEPPSLAEYLKSSLYITSDDEEVRRLAAEAIGDAEGDQGGRLKDPVRIVDRLRKHVRKTVTANSLDAAFDTAAHVARAKQGSCSELAVLLCAMARASGIPARVVGGVVYSQPFGLGFATGKWRGFYPHMWTQVFVGGRWMDIDASFLETAANPTHIAFQVSSLNGISPERSSLIERDLQAGRLRLEILEVDPPSAMGD